MPSVSTAMPCGRLLVADPVTSNPPGISSPSASRCTTRFLLVSATQNPPEPSSAIWCGRLKAAVLSVILRTNSPFGREHVDPVVLAVGHVDLAVTDQDVAREHQRAVLRAVVALLPGEAAVGVELLDPVVEPVGDVQLAGGAVGQAERSVEAAGRRPGATDGVGPGRGRGAAVPDRDPVVEGVAHGDLLGPRDGGHAVRRDELVRVRAIGVGTGVAPSEAPARVRCWIR